ncbi:NAD(P)H-dependent flavin oxidoreductase [Aliibacillus thermotolerans]|uniref:Probable nitronate monooxygenase n=1 Tax=Aliibacillus thermotolerans TaxID=1834418 RepID=A0ABW0U5H3_9BACI|nr:nitronate monooxygenase [Aliibacillus thermotolerans]MDA3130901.1 nitronate monooxygenase [Aliibacillus thermotolerans]
MKKDIRAQLQETMRLPVIMAPMFLVSNPQTVVEGCKNGIIGSFPSLNARDASILDEWMTTIKKELAEAKQTSPDKKIAPWAVNFVCHRSHNKRYEEDLALIKKHEPPIVICSLGDPKPIVDIVHSYDGIVFADVINTFFAKKAIEKGVDGLILVCNGAGGHAGTFHPMAFIKEVKAFYDGITILAGSISEGDDILASEVLGADFVYIGTKFIAAKESSAPTEYQKMLVSSTMEDIMYTDVFSGIHANYLIPSIERAGIDIQDIQKKKVSKETLRQSLDVKAWKDIWSAGHGVGAIDRVQTVREIIQDLERCYEEARKKITDKGVKVK